METSLLGILLRLISTCWTTAALPPHVDHCRVFDTGDDADLTTAFAAGFDIDMEHAIEALHPAHEGGRFVVVDETKNRCGRICPVFGSSNFHQELHLSRIVEILKFSEIPK